MSSVCRILAKILMPAGTKDVPVGKPLCIIVSPDSRLPLTLTSSRIVSIDSSSKIALLTYYRLI
jgi:hypothetical protein